MIITSLPMRPRASGVPASYLMTPAGLINPFSQPDQKTLFPLTCVNMSAEERDKKVSSYASLIKKVFSVEENFFITDDNKEFTLYCEKKLKELKPTVRKYKGLSCACGKFEEVINVRQYDLRRVDKENRCTYCKGFILEKEKEGLFLKIPWDNEERVSFRKEFSKKDFDHFVGRQNKGGEYLISKDIEATKININNKNFGLRHQILWAMLLCFMSEKFHDPSISLRYVDKVSSKAFFVGSMAQFIKKDINIEYYSLPLVHFTKDKTIEEVGGNEIRGLWWAMNKKRKEVIINDGLANETFKEIKFKFL